MGGVVGGREAHRTGPRIAPPAVFAATDSERRHLSTGAMSIRGASLQRVMCGAKAEGGGKRGEGSRGEGERVCSHRTYAPPLPPEPPFLRGRWRLELEAVVSEQQKSMFSTGTSKQSSAVMFAPPTPTPVFDMPSLSGLSLLVESTSRSRTLPQRTATRMITHHARWLIVASSHWTTLRLIAKVLVRALARWM